MEKVKINLFDLSGCLSREALLAWKENMLSLAEKYKVEEHLKECEFCKEALEGIGGIGAQQLRNSLADINQRMQQHLIKPALVPEKKSTLKLKLSLAAAIFLTLVGIFFLFKFLPEEKNPTIAQDLPQPVLSEKSPSISSETKAKTTEPPVNMVAPEEKAPSPTITSSQAESEIIETPEKSGAPNEEVVSQAPEEQQMAELKQEDNERSVQPQMMSKKKAESQVVGYAEKSIAEESADETTYYEVDQPAMFQGGEMNKFKVYIEEKLNAKSGINAGNISIAFTVDRKGKVKDLHVIKGIDSKTDSLAMATIKDSPKWQPAKNKGKDVNIKLLLQLNIKSK